MIKLNGARSVIKSSFFPNFRTQNSPHKYKTLIGVGGNVGNTKRYFETFLQKIKKDRRFFVKECSCILKNKAFGFEAQNDFLNTVMLINTSLYANSLLKIMQHYEKIFKRKRSFKNAPRTLDLDILYFSKKVLNSERLTLPHQGVNSRISVIFPIGVMKGI